jgi:hypothetical protein
MSHAHTPPPKPDTLYERDLYAWSLEQARLLRAGDFAAIDAENIAEEILDVGRTEYRILGSALAVLLMHMLKWDYESERRSRSWVNTIVEQRNRVVKRSRTATRTHACAPHRRQQWSLTTFRPNARTAGTTS